MANLAHLSNVLVCEDEALILMDIESTLVSAGVATVLSAMSLEEGLALVERGGFEAAVLDLHLGRDGWSYEIAQRLRDKGVPFIFSSGTIDVVDGFREVPLVMKPFSTDQLVAALLQVTGTSRPAAAADHPYSTSPAL